MYHLRVPFKVHHQPFAQKSEGTTKAPEHADCIFQDGQATLPNRRPEKENAQHDFGVLSKIFD